MTPPVGFVFSPHYCQYLYSDLGVNNERNLGPIVTRKFQKYHDHTVLRITWEGNFRSVQTTKYNSHYFISTLIFSIIEHVNINYPSKN